MFRVRIILTRIRKELNNLYFLCHNMGIERSFEACQILFSLTTKMHGIIKNLSPIHFNSANASCKYIHYTVFKSTEMFTFATSPVSPILRCCTRFEYQRYICSRQDFVFLSSRKVFPLTRDFAAPALQVYKKRVHPGFEPGWTEPKSMYI